MAVQVLVASFLAVLAVAVTDAKPKWFHARSSTQCPTANDVVFVLDESGSIYHPHFLLQLDFVNDFIDRFDTTFNVTHIGVMTFSDDVTTHMDLDDSHDKGAMKSRVSGIGQLRGQTMTNLAIDHMRTQMYSPGHARSWAPHIAIVITDGNPDYKDLTAQAAARAHAAGITVIAIGVGRDIDSEVLASIASRSDLVFPIDNYAGLDEILTQLAGKTCQVATVPPTIPTTTLPLMISGCRSHSTVDIAFSLPDAMGIIDTDYALGFVDGMVTEFELSPTRVQVALTARYCVEGRGIWLQEYDNTRRFSTALYQRRRLHGAPTHLHLASLITETFSPDNGAREGARKVAIIVVDNPSAEDTDDLISAAKEMGIHLIVIAVGQNVMDSELLSLASSPEDVFRVRSYGDLLSLQANMLSRVCEVALGISELDIADF